MGRARLPEEGRQCPFHPICDLWRLHGRRDRWWNRHDVQHGRRTIAECA